MTTTMIARTMPTLRPRADRRWYSSLLGPSGLQHADLIAKGRRVDTRANEDEHEPETDGAGDPESAEWDARVHDHEEPGDQQQHVGGIREAVVEELDRAQDVALRGLRRFRGTGQPDAVGGVEPDRDDRLCPRRDRDRGAVHAARLPR